MSSIFISFLRHHLSQYNASNYKIIGSFVNRPSINAVSIVPELVFHNDKRLCHKVTNQGTEKHADLTASTILRSGPGAEKFRKLTRRELKQVSHPYVNLESIDGNGKKVFFETHGCQMNVSDTEIAWSILHSHGYKLADTLENADVILIMTCAIREGAEDKIWNKLKNLGSIKKNKRNLKVGILGCMAERLKTKLIEKEDIVDVVAGPDSYKDLPRLLAITDMGQKSINVLLSHDETYADIKPVSMSPNKVIAYVSIMRGCDNMCSYCIVPFTRGKERSRDISSIVEEIKIVSDQGVKEVILLGQNVNSYRDVSETNFHLGGSSSGSNEIVPVAKGFKTVYKPKHGGRRFADLLDKVSSIDPEMRIRFTSPHPKDFPDEVLSIINERHNICKQIHLPAQSGNTRILELMRRGYSRESYLELVAHIKSLNPLMNLTSDFICGFCGETEEEFADTMSLVEKIGKHHLVLIEGVSRRSENHLAGRNDGNVKVILPNIEMQVGNTDKLRCAKPGDYVHVIVSEASSQTLKASPVAISSIASFYQ